MYAAGSRKVSFYQELMSGRTWYEPILPEGMDVIAYGNSDESRSTIRT